MKLSVVIPTLDEAEHIEAAILAVTCGALHARDFGSRASTSGAAPLAFGPSSSPAGIAPSTGPGSGAIAWPGSPASAAPASFEQREEVEVIVVDGGSVDATVQRAESLGVRVLHGPRGRAGQLREGVLASRGDAVLLLHADTRLPPGWAAAVRQALADERVVGGAFRLRFDERSLAFRLMEWGVRLRVALWSLPYGDQALFVRRATLDAIGGIPQVPVMEDLDLVVAMKRRGRLARLPLPAITSARRYRARGPLRTMLRHGLAAVAWALGVDRARVAHWAGR